MGYQTLTNSVVKAICKKIFNKSPSSDLHATRTDIQQEGLSEFIIYFVGIEYITFQAPTEVKTPFFPKKGLECMGSFHFGFKAYSNHNFTIRFQTNQLLIVINHQLYELQDYQQLITLYDKLKIEAEKADLKYHTTRAEAEKKAKIKELKKNAILAKVVALAKTEGLPYMISTHYATKIIFWLRLSDRTAMNVHIPYTDYQNVLQNTQTTIQAIRKLVNEKMHISVFNSPTTANFKWQDPKMS